MAAIPPTEAAIPTHQKKIPTPNKRRNRYTIKDDESPAEFATRVFQAEGQEHFTSDTKQQKNLSDLRGLGGLNISNFAELAAGGDSKHDPWIKRNMGVDIPRDYVPKFAQTALNMSIDANGIQTNHGEFTDSQKKLFGAWLPEAKVASMTDTDAPLGIRNAAAGKSKGLGSVFMWPKYWQNIYQYQDYLVLQDNYANTIAGRILDVIVYFTIANGIKPKLEPKDKSKYSDEELTAALDKARWATTVFEQIDQQITEGTDAMPYAEFNADGEPEFIPNYSVAANDAPTYDTPLTQKWASFLTLTLNFGRCAMVPNVDANDNKVSFKVDGQEKSYKGIPKIFQILHPRDMGFNHVDPVTWRLLGIQIYNSNWILKPQQMLFMEYNAGNPVYGAMYYGYSMLQSMMGSARTLRRIIEVDFPLIAKTRWSGMYWIFFKRKGEMGVSAAAEHQALLSAIDLQGINVGLEDDPQTDVRIENLDLDPKISELIEMCKFLIQYMMSQVGMPQGLLFGEQDLNRDTFKTAVQTFTKGGVKKYRRLLLHTATQHYRRIAATITPQDAKLKAVLDEFNVVATVDEFNLESPTELANALIVLENAVGGKFTTQAQADFLEMSDLAQKLDPDSGPEDVPQMGGGSKMNIKNDEGKSFEVSH